jgi:processive 1,2-diacylglycerol beta-glucosyltransferase
MRVLILFCEEGEGHAAAARVLAGELAGAGAEVVVEDAMRRGLGRLIPLLSRDAYRVQVQVRRLRWSYGLEYLLFTRFPPTRWLGRRGLALFGSRPLLRVLGEAAPDVVVSTHPAVTNVLGFLRRRGRLAVPVVATITDFGAHALWAHPGVDLHLVMHDALVPAVEDVAGRDSAVVIAPIVSAAFGAGRVRAEARRALDLPARRPLVLVSGGGWGVGDLEMPVEAALGVPWVTVVCLSGRNEVVRRRLERRFAGEVRLQVVPFTDRMPEFLAAADVLVDATLGVTCLEALRAGCRVVACGAPPGHSRDNARALARLGLAEIAASPAELREILARSVDLPPAPAALSSEPSAAEAILAAGPRVVPERGHRRTVAATAAASLTALVVAGWTFASPTPYPVVARVLDLEALTSVDTAAPEVAVIVLTPPRRIPALAGELALHRIRASFAVASPLAASEQQALARLHDDLLPALTPTGTSGILRAHARLAQLRRTLHLGARFYYLQPSGFTLSDYLAARTAGGLPIAASPRLRAGSVVVVDARHGYRSRAVATLASSLERRGMRAVPLSELLASGASTRPTGAARASARAPMPVATSPAARPASRSADAGHHSRASSGASATGTNVVRANTIGAT